MAKAQWKWGDVLKSVTGKPTGDNVVHLRRRSIIDSLCDELDVAKDKLVAHINEVPALREDVRRLQHEIARQLEARDTGIDWTIQALPTLDLETLEMHETKEDQP